MQTILVTGGCGYIGSHTIVDLIESGYDVISIDNLSRANPEVFKGIQKIIGNKIKNYKIDLCDLSATRRIFAKHKITGIIHFAAYKMVGESVEKPIEYYKNNLDSLINILACAKEFKIKNLVFSSSCSVYGNASVLPVTEDTICQKAESPYAACKQMGEIMIDTFCSCQPLRSIVLRYFNPAGAHPSNFIGEVPVGKPQNLVPVITRVALGIVSKMAVFGNDYDTRDGSCIRDFIHICDLAHAHTLAIKYLVAHKAKQSYEIFNLGTGNGITVLETIASFEKVNGLKVNYKIAPRRSGDVIAVYANLDKAKTVLKWEPKYTVDDIMKTAWEWDKKMLDKKLILLTKNKIM
ncbi:MAG: UDP-glucose 4-epimerase GalE [Chitinophagaceae bacterium]